MFQKLKRGGKIFAVGSGSQVLGSMNHRSQQLRFGQALFSVLILSVLIGVQK
jgi:hypothetical protein